MTAGEKEYFASQEGSMIVFLSAISISVDDLRQVIQEIKPSVRLTPLRCQRGDRIGVNFVAVHESATMIIKTGADFPKIGGGRKDFFKEPYPASTAFIAPLQPRWAGGSRGSGG